MTNISPFRMEKEKYKVLLVEDDSNFGQVLKNYLELNDFIVELSRDGILGLAAFRREKFDICLLDVMMPNMDGPETLAGLREFPTLATTPVVFMTAKVQPQEVQAYLDLGAVGVIAKPFDPMLLVDQLREIWERQ